MTTSRDLDIVLLGPTGYTGKLCAEHIKDLKGLNSNRAEPEVIVVSLTKDKLDPVFQRTTVVINCISPYHLYSTPAVEACASNGTHYIDVAGETPWVREMIRKYHQLAKSTGAIIIPSAGLESAPPDLLSWNIAKCIRDNYDTGVKDMIVATHELIASGPSGGTLSTILNVVENYSLADLARANDPFCPAFTPRPHSKKPAKTPLLRSLFGVRRVPDLGILTSSPAEICDTATMHRSSTMLPEIYGQDYEAKILVRVQSTLMGILMHVGFNIALASLLLPPVRWLVKQFVYSPGQGPKQEAVERERVEYRGIMNQFSHS